MVLHDIANELKKASENIILIYAFNGTGKTRLSKEYKDITKNPDQSHTGVYYNAYSEDLFIWNNDEPNNNDRIRLEIVESTLSALHQYLGDEESIKEKLKLYKPAYDFRFKYKNDNQEEGIEYVWFFKSDDPDTWIKISRGEERIFVWCFFLALFEIEDFADAHKDYIYIDDPVSSLDDMNIYVTAQILFDLFADIVNHNKKIIVSTHHIGLFSILCDWLKKGENSHLFKQKTITETKTQAEEGFVVKETIKESNKYLIRLLEKNGNEYYLKSQNKGAWLYHLLILQILKEDIDNDNLYLYHFGLLRQVLETISSFLGEGRFGFVLHQIGMPDDTADKVNTFSHKRVYDSQNAKLTADNKATFKSIFEGLMTKYQFNI